MQMKKNKLRGALNSEPGPWESLINIHDTTYMIIWHHPHKHLHDHLGMFRGQFRGTHFLLWWERCQQNLEPGWEESRNKTSHWDQQHQLHMPLSWLRIGALLAHPPTVLLILMMKKPSCPSPSCTQYLQWYSLQGTAFVLGHDKGMMVNCPSQAGWAMKVQVLFTGQTGRQSQMDPLMKTMTMTGEDTRTDPAGLGPTNWNVAGHRLLIYRSLGLRAQCPELIISQIGPYYLSLWGFVNINGTGLQEISFIGFGSCPFSGRISPLLLLPSLQFHTS